MIRKDFLTFGAPLIEDDEISEVVDTLQSGWLGTGPKVARFEADFKKYKNADYAIAVNSGTAALQLSICAAGIKPGDEVITSALTFCATVNAIIHSGAKPVLADCDIETQCISPNSILEKITPKTKAIIPVHFAGYACDMDAIMSIAEKYNLIVIEDCAHAIETKYKGKHVGTFGSFGCFSFYVTKNVATGEGGMVLTKTQNDADQIKILALHGMSKDAWHRFTDNGYKHYEVVSPGFKFNMMDLQAAIGIHQLKRVERNLQIRNKIWNQYQSAFEELPIQLPADHEPYVKHGRHLYTVLVDSAKCGISRDEFIGALFSENIGTGVHYRSIPMHLYYQETFGWKPEQFPNSDKIGQETASLPLSANLNEQDVEDVINAVHKILNRP